MYLEVHVPTVLPGTDLIILLYIKPMMNPMSSEPMMNDGRAEAYILILTSLFLLQHHPRC